MKTNPNAAVITPKEICSEYDASPPTVYAWLNRDDCPAFKFGRKWIVPRDLFHQWIIDQAGQKRVVG